MVSCAPSASAWNFAQAILGWPTRVPSPQSVLAITHSRPTRLAYCMRRSATNSGCSMKSVAGVTKKRGQVLQISHPRPNNPVELTAHSAGFLGCPWRCRLWAAAHRGRSGAPFNGARDGSFSEPSMDHGMRTRQRASRVGNSWGPKPVQKSTAVAPPRVGDRARPALSADARPRCGKRRDAGGVPRGEAPYKCRLFSRSFGTLCWSLSLIVVGRRTLGPWLGPYLSPRECLLRA